MHIHSDILLLLIKVLVDYKRLRRHALICWQWCTGIYIVVNNYIVFTVIVNNYYCNYIVIAAVSCRRGNSRYHKDTMNLCMKYSLCSGQQWTVIG